MAERLGKTGYTHEFKTAQSAASSVQMNELRIGEAKDSVGQPNGTVATKQVDRKSLVDRLTEWIGGRQKAQDRTDGSIGRPQANGTATVRMGEVKIGDPKKATGQPDGTSRIKPKTLPKLNQPRIAERQPGQPSQPGAPSGPDTSKRRADGTVAIAPDDRTTTLKQDNTFAPPSSARGGATVRKGEVKIGDPKKTTGQPDGTSKVKPETLPKLNQPRIAERQPSQPGAPSDPDTSKRRADGTVAIAPNDPTATLKQDNTFAPPSSPRGSATVRMGEVKIGDPKKATGQPDGTSRIKPETLPILNQPRIAERQPGQPSQPGASPGPDTSKRRADGTVAIAPNDRTATLKQNNTFAPPSSANGDATVRMGEIKIGDPKDVATTTSRGPWVLTTPTLRYAAPDAQFCRNHTSPVALEFNGIQPFVCRNVSTGRALIFKGVPPPPSPAVLARAGRLSGNVKVALLRVTPIDGGAGVNPFDFQQVAAAIEAARTGFPRRLTIAPSTATDIGVQLFLDEAGISIGAHTISTPPAVVPLNTNFANFNNSVTTNHGTYHAIGGLGSFGFSPVNPSSTADVTYVNSTTVRLVTLRLSDRNYFAVTVRAQLVAGVAPFPLAERVQLTIQSAFNCGPKLSDCP